MKVCESVPCRDEEVSTVRPLTTVNIEENLIPTVLENDDQLEEEGSVRTLCKSGESQYYQHETNCSQFYHCQHGEPVVKFCDDPLLYNPEQHICDWADNVHEIRPMCKHSSHINTNGTLSSQQVPTLQAKTEEGSSIAIVHPSRSPPGHCDSNE